jgi:hypothetical protein
MTFRLSAPQASDTFIAGLVLIVVVLGLLPKHAPSGNSPLATAAISPRLVRSPVPLSTEAVAARVSAAPTEDELSALLRSGRFDELVRRAPGLADAEARERWLSTCVRLAPASLVASPVHSLPAGPLRERLLGEVMEHWVLADPVSFGEWAIAHLADSRELDFALARITAHTDRVHRPTSTALAWAGLIRDPELRFRALSAVVREWVDSDPDAALRYTESSAGLSAEERSRLLRLCTPPLSES